MFWETMLLRMICYQLFTRDIKIDNRHVDGFRQELPEYNSHEKGPHRGMLATYGVGTVARRATWRETARRSASP